MCCVRYIRYIKIAHATLRRAIMKMMVCAVVVKWWRQRSDDAKKMLYTLVLCGSPHHKNTHTTMPFSIKGKQYFKNMLIN